MTLPPLQTIAVARVYSESVLFSSLADQGLTQDIAQHYLDTPACLMYPGNADYLIAARIAGYERWEIAEYPYPAICEAIANAVAHRDYVPYW